jgi:hypothetical protein
MAKTSHLALGNLNTANHAYAQRTHAYRRLYKRYGFTIGLSEYQEACGKIRDGKCPAIGPGRIGGTLHILTIRSKEVVAVWDSETDQISTFLPKGTRQ